MKLWFRSNNLIVLWRCPSKGSRSLLFSMSLCLRDRNLTGIVIPRWVASRNVYMDIFPFLLSTIGFWIRWRITSIPTLGLRLRWKISKQMGNEMFLRYSRMGWTFIGLRQPSCQLFSTCWCLTTPIILASFWQLRPRIRRIYCWDN